MRTHTMLGAVAWWLERCMATVMLVVVGIVLIGLLAALQLV